MNPSTKSVSQLQRRSRRHQPFGCSMLELDQKHKNLYRESVHTDQDRQSLDESKKELRDLIAEYRKCELVLSQDRDAYSDSLDRLEKEVNDAFWYSDNDPKDKGVPDLIRQNDGHCVTLSNGHEQLRAATQQLNFAKHLVVPMEDNQSESPNRSQSVLPKIRIPNIDKSDIIKKNGSINLDSWQRNKCCVCVKEPANTVLFDCTHLCVCWTCAEEIRMKKGTCPICHHSIEKIIKIYHV